ncbi:MULTISPECIES: MarR family winged helix-turn-helix transcriptional regulator [unclassified Microbacterium]|uniref:MarR family winged helix-turn-helix transcriptional regulator n=1 Tax=unclassified Microbacterium TaxID=2609290 RepID=UPI0016053857|nr:MULTISPECIES: MarR family transcriptional regulator [unclassified Microbacterium]QNA93578.1 MarR family transcriptional regulator [Microbacterium sp. Se63.02b]QYM63835.1 MarR family transcriptional regulator [Microbacterium sp. Se5.02b]
MTPHALDDSLCHALYTATQATVRLYRDLLAPWGLSYQQVVLLAVLWDQGELTAGKIAEHLHLDSSSVTGLLTRMETAGLVERSVDAADRRRVLVRSTARGLAIRDELGWLEDCIARALGVEADEARDLLARLSALRESVKAFPPDDVHSDAGRESALQTS